MTGGRDGRDGSGWLAVLALPVLCCAGHLLLVGLGGYALVAAVGAAVVGPLGLTAGLLLLLVVAAVYAARAARRRGDRRPT